jgi:hypothetical protein
MRSCFSGAAFSMASPVETRQAFLEGHVLAFAWFGGGFAEVRYDNLGSAVKKVLRGRSRCRWRGRSASSTSYSSLHARATLDGGSRGARDSA